MTTARLSAVLIVKDEERVLGACLAALAPAVDEVVVYDTGSTDRTREIAREHGAVVVEGFWDQHFGDARNRALAHASGEWVVSVDADEVLTGDVGALRRVCAAAPQGLARLAVVSTAWPGATDGARSVPVRLFRRGAFRWVGALHEYLAPLPGTATVTEAPTASGVRLLHSGYEYLTFSDRDKGVRNLEIAAAAVAALPVSGEEPTAVWDAYGRSLLVAGRHGEALEALDRVLEHQGNPSVVLQAGRSALSVVLERQDARRAELWLDALERHGEAPAAVAAWRARAALAAGDLDAAQRHLDDARRASSRGARGPAFDEAVLHDLRAGIATAHGRHAEALEALLASLHDHPDHLGLTALASAADRAAVPVDSVARRVPKACASRLAREAVLLGDDDAEAWLSALHAAHPGEPDVVVAGAVVAPRGGLERAVAWSAAVRSLGLAHLCPLRALGADTTRTTSGRVLAWALVAGVAEDDDARDELALLLSALEPQSLLELAGPLVDLVPSVAHLVLRAVEASVAQLQPAGA